jgi:DUF1365 family protein
LFGYVFNPLSIWYCEDREGRMRAILYEVANTFGETHGYLLDVPETPGSASAPIRQDVDKCFYVSPFLDMDCRYRFRLNRPEERLSVLIREEDGEGDEILIAAHTANRQPLTDRTLGRALISHPLMTMKVMLGIHWEALKLVLKGARYHRRPPPPREEVSW